MTTMENKDIVLLFKVSSFLILNVLKSIFLQSAGKGYRLCFITYKLHTYGFRQYRYDTWSS